MLAASLMNMVAVGVGVGTAAAAAAGSLAIRAATSWKEERDAERAKADRLEEENKTLSVENADLKAKTDLSAIKTHLEMIESGLAGSFAAIMQSQRDTAEILERVTKLLDKEKP